jgi:hypothetical protein
MWFRISPVEPTAHPFTEPGCSRLFNGEIATSDGGDVPLTGVFKIVTPGHRDI